MATRTDLTMLQNLNRRLRTGLWHIPPQWRALRRVPGWSYPNVPVRQVKVAHQGLYASLFQRIPMLRLEGARLGETPVDGVTGSSTASRSVTQQMVLRWHELITKHNVPSHAAFEQIRVEFKEKLDNLTSHLLRAKAEAVDRHAKLTDAKIKRDALHEELGRPERYAERLEGLVNRALHLNPQEPHQYFSESMSRKLLKQLNKEHVRKNLQEKTSVLRRQLDESKLGQDAHAAVAKRGGPVPEEALALPAVAAALPASTNAAASASHEAGVGSVPSAPASKRFPNAISSFPTMSSGLEPVPVPEVYFHRERAWATGTYNEYNSLGARKDQRMTEFHRHIDRMHVEDGATLADYLAYVLYTQVRTLQCKRLQHWPPYTDYLDHKLFFRAYRLIQTGISRSSVNLRNTSFTLTAQQREKYAAATLERRIRAVKNDAKVRAGVAKRMHAAKNTEGAAAEAEPRVEELIAFLRAEHAAKKQPAALLAQPKVRAINAVPLSFQQCVTHQRLLTLLQSHLAATPLVSLRDTDTGESLGVRDDGYVPPRELPLTPFWQEVQDEKVRWKHPGEGWYNARIEETRYTDSLLYEHDRIEAQQRAKWAAERQLQREQAAEAAAGGDSKPQQ